MAWHHPLSTMKTFLKEIFDFLLLYFSVDIPFTIAYYATAVILFNAGITFAYVAWQSAVVSMLIVILWKIKHWFKVHRKTNK